MKIVWLCVAVLSIACASDGDSPLDAARVRDDGGVHGDASKSDASDGDASKSPSDAMPGAFQLTLSTTIGGTVSVFENSVDLGFCPSDTICTHTITAGATLQLAAVAGALQHCTWTGACLGFPKGSSCFRTMDQDYSVGATFDAIDADCR